MAKRTDPAMAEIFMLQKGLRPLEPFKNVDEPWKCKCLKCGKNVAPRLSGLQQGRGGCAYCAGIKLDPEDAVNVMLAADLTPLEPYNKATTKWKCKCNKCGNTVSPTYHQIKNGDGGCSNCGGNEKLTLDQVKILVAEREGKLLSTTYVSVDSTLEFECSKGHRFQNTFSHIKRGNQWCPTCNKGSKSEEIARTTFEQLFGYKFPKHRPKWLRNSLGNRMEIDGFCHELKIGFEYQGRQHFDLALYGTDLDRRKKDDQMKADLCKANGVLLFILDFRMKYHDFPKEIEAQAKEFQLKLPQNFRELEIDIYRAYIRNDRIDELKKLLESKEIKVLSPKYLGSNQMIDLRCLICGYEWSAKGNAFFNSRRVSGCNQCARKNVGASAKLNIGVLQEFAASFGGQLLSEDYLKSQYKYSWKCSEGHIFDQRYSNMKHRSQFCPICEGRQLRKIK